MDFKKIPVKIYGLLALFLALTIAAGILFGRILVNHSFVVSYAKGNYQPAKEEGLLTLNVPESYLPYYNLGNVAFEKEDYNSAIGYYTRALSLYPVGQKECDIRINLALSMCYSIDFDNLTTQDSLDSAQVILYKARDILLTNKWATENGAGHRDDDAQQLKEDIDRMLEQLQNPNGDDSQNDPNQDEEDKDDGENSDDSDKSNNQTEKEKRQKDKLDRNKKDALEERKQDQDFLDKYGSRGDGEDAAGIGEKGGSYKPW